MGPSANGLHIRQRRTSIGGAVHRHLSDCKAACHHCPTVGMSSVDIYIQTLFQKYGIRFVATESTKNIQPHTKYTRTKQPNRAIQKQEFEFQKQKSLLVALYWYIFCEIVLLLLLLFWLILFPYRSVMVGLDATFKPM